MTPIELAALIPEITVIEKAFPAGDRIDPVFDELTPIAHQWAEQNPNSWGFRFFSDLFYKGGKAPQANEVEGITGADTNRVYQWITAAMGSYYPKHEDKEAVCGMLWATFFEEPNF
jgi:hypothetical protein